MSTLSELNGKTFTIINQIPASQTNPQKTAWRKYTLKNCDKKDGLYDKSTGQTVIKANTWTAYISDWQSYQQPTYQDGGYYALSDKDKKYTVNVGDLIIFADITDNAPTTVQEFAALRDKYSGMGGIITACEVFIKYKNNGQPWKTNHVEVIKS